MNRCHRRHLAVLPLLAIMAGCGSPESTASPAGRAPATTAPAVAAGAPSGSPATIWTPPRPLPEAAPGTVIRSVPAPAIGGGTALLVQYHSRTTAGADIAVTASVFVPPAKAAAGTTIPVVAYGHGTVGLADACAPSHLAADADPVVAQLVSPFLDSGFAVVIADFQGLGTPGEHPYLLGESEGRNVLDAVRAAQRLDLAGIAADSPVLGVGHSQGGGAVLFAGELARTYAPEVKLAGVVAQAPGTQLETAWAGVRTSDTRGYIAMLASGILANYPGVPRTDVVTDAGQRTIDRIRTQCSDPILPELATTDLDTLMPRTISPALRSELRANTPGYRRPGVPVLIVHGTQDEQVPVAYSRSTAELYRSIGADVRLIEYPTDHQGVIPASGKDLLAFATRVLVRQR
jgi:alpha-beta hydrolase superfamily lysophospholipase